MSPTGEPTWRQRSRAASCGCAQRPAMSFMRALAICASSSRATTSCVVSARKGFQDDRLELVAVLVAPGVAVEARVGRERGVLQHHLAKDLPFALVLQAEHDGAAVARIERAIGIDAGVRRAGARRRRRPIEGVVHRIAHPLGQRFEHGHIDVAALPGLAAQQQRREDAGVGIHAGRDIGHRVAGLARRLGRARDREETRPRSGSAGHTPSCRGKGRPRHSRRCRRR